MCEREREARECGKETVPARGRKAEGSGAELTTTRATMRRTLCKTKRQLAAGEEGYTREQEREKEKRRKEEKKTYRLHRGGGELRQTSRRRPTWRRRCTSAGEHVLPLLAAQLPMLTVSLSSHAGTCSEGEARDKTRRERRHEKAK